MVVADIFQCPENVIGHEPQDWAFYLPWAFALQLAILFAQDRLGPAFFIPRSVRRYLLRSTHLTNFHGLSGTHRTRTTTTRYSRRQIPKHQSSHSATVPSVWTRYSFRQQNRHRRSSNTVC